MAAIRLTALPGGRPVALGAAAALLLALGQPGAPRAAEAPLRLAMHDMMPMQQQGSSGGTGMMDDGMRMGGMQGQPAQGGAGGAGTGGMPGMGQPGGGAQPGQAMRGGMGMGGMQGQPAQGGMGMDDDMRRRGMGMGMGMGGAGMAMDDMSRMMNRAGPHAALDRVEGRLAFLRAELRVTDAQAPAWEELAQALRSARQHLVESRGALQVAGHATHTPAERLEAYERHLGARLEAVRAVRGAFFRLHGMLDEAQKQTAAELVVPFVESF